MMNQINSAISECLGSEFNNMLGSPRYSNFLNINIKKIENMRGNKYLVAILVSNTDHYIISAIHTALSEIHEMPFITKVFKYKDEALRWFNLEPESIKYF